MAIIRTPCPLCAAEVRLHSDEIVLRTQADGAGSYAFVCVVCQRVATKPADATTAALLCDVGVIPDADPAPGHPEMPSAGPALTPDDVLDFHLLLRGDVWLAELAALAPTPPEKGSACTR